ncbi:UNVERIFIED_CONTAM: hypothetical protein PYX00_006605 [Menopon gallinae]|uniref:Uncharacterized protein n=1 Tax=Menopon gallinae TaxID=328185 RepID=A0AAW2HW48_9NEOP
MDLTTRQRPLSCDDKTGRMAKSIFSIRSLMDVGEDGDGLNFKSRHIHGKSLQLFLTTPPSPPPSPVRPFHPDKHARIII